MRYLPAENGCSPGLGRAAHELGSEVRNSICIQRVIFVLALSGRLLKHIKLQCVATVDLFVLVASAAECKPCSLPLDFGIVLK